MLASGIRLEQIEAVVHAKHDGRIYLKKPPLAVLV
jgi:hypothetical protein